MAIKKKTFRVPIRNFAVARETFVVEISFTVQRKAFLSSYLFHHNVPLGAL